MRKNYKNLIKHFLIDSIFFALLGGLLLFARKRIVDYILQLSLYAEQVAYVSQMAQEQGSAMLEEVEALAAVVEPLTKNLQLYVYILVPLGLWLIWSLTQSLNYNLLSKKKLFDFKAIGYFLLINVPFFVVLLLFIEFLFRQISVDIAINFNLTWIILIVLVLILLIYFIQVFYCFMHKFKFLKAVKNSFKLALKKFHILFPLTFVNVIIFVLAFIFLWNVLIKIVSDTGGYVLSVVLLIVFIFLYGYYRKFLVGFIRKKDK